VRHRRIQNKFHYAIVGKTAPEIIYSKADNTKENMGLTTWKNSPDGRILKTDVIVAKNYLELDEIKRLERLVVGYFDYVEDVIERENTFTMEEFARSVNEFLKLDKSIQENIVDLAEQNYLKENSTINIEMLEVIKKNTYRTYLKMIYFKLLEIIKKNNLKVGDTL